MTAPHRSSLMNVKSDWIDFNGHLNMAYYNVLFDQGADELFAGFGFGPDYAKRTGFSTFSAEFHVCYLREVHEGNRVYVTSQLLDFDEKRFHFFQNTSGEPRSGGGSAPDPPARIKPARPASPGPTSALRHIQIQRERMDATDQRRPQVPAFREARMSSVALAVVHHIKLSRREGRLQFRANFIRLRHFCSAPLFRQHICGILMRLNP